MIAVRAPLVFQAMGTVVSVRCEAPLPDAVAAAIRGAFDDLEDRFTLYRASEAREVADRRLPLRRASEEYRRVYDLALDWRDRTDGAFTPHRPDGVIDLAGVVKALGIQAAVDRLDAAGLGDWCLNAGGDVVVSGAQTDATPWTVGIVDPADRGRLLSAYVSDGGRRAVATSGVAERGDHVWRIGADRSFRQVTVVADDIVTADVLATAILAGGPATLARCESDWSLDVLACGEDGSYRASARFRS